MTISELAAILISNGWQLEVAFYFDKCYLAVYPCDSTAYPESIRAGQISQLDEFISELYEIYKVTENE